MNSKFSFEQKKKLVIVLIILGIALLYKKSISNTYSEITTYYSRKTNGERFKDLGNDIKNIEAKIGYIDNIIGDEVLDEKLIQENIVGFLSNKVKGEEVLVASLKPVHRVTVEDYMVITNVVVLKGDYNSLMKVIYAFDKEFKKSRLNSMRMFVKKKYSTRKEELYAELFFQNFVESEK